MLECASLVTHSTMQYLLHNDRRVQMRGVVCVCVCMLECASLVTHSTMQYLPHNDRRVQMRGVEQRTLQSDTRHGILNGHTTLSQSYCYSSCIEQERAGIMWLMVRAPTDQQQVEQAQVLLHTKNTSPVLPVRAVFGYLLIYARIWADQGTRNKLAPIPDIPGNTCTTTKQHKQSQKQHHTKHTFTKQSHTLSHAHAKTHNQ